MTKEELEKLDNKELIDLYKTLLEHKDYIDSEMEKLEETKEEQSEKGTGKSL